jgi:hypothetical protein
MLVTRFFRGISLNRFATAFTKSCSVIALNPIQLCSQYEFTASRVVKWRSRRYKIAHINIKSLEIAGQP